MKSFNRTCWITLIVGVLFLTACTNYKDEEFEVLILDEANILSKETKEWLRKYKYPKGFVFAVRTEKAIPSALVGAVADDLFKATVDRHPKKDAFEQRGVLLDRQQILVVTQVVARQR